MKIYRYVNGDSKCCRCCNIDSRISREIAQRPSPQGALVKALLVLGAQDINSRDIPNNDEGWGVVNLKETLAPSQGRGIWVDDRSVLTRSGASKSYVFNVTYANSQLKAVLAWSDYRGSRFASKALVNDLDLEVESPDGTVYLGNDFANGRSTTGGTKDDINNLEVVLGDSAMKGIWTMRVKGCLSCWRWFATVCYCSIWTRCERLTLRSTSGP